MKRRQFIKAVSAGAAVASVPAIVFGSHSTIPVKEWTDAAVTKSANSFDSEYTKKLAQKFLRDFERSLVHTHKNVDLSILKGDTVTFKRSTDHIG